LGSAALIEFDSSSDVTTLGGAGNLFSEETLATMQTLKNPVAEHGLLRLPHRYYLNQKKMAPQHLTPPDLTISRPKRETSTSFTSSRHTSTPRPSHGTYLNGQARVLE
jgi:hypothetical protein